MTTLFHCIGRSRNFWCHERRSSRYKALRIEAFFSYKCHCRTFLKWQDILIRYSPHHCQKYNLKVFRRHLSTKKYRLYDLFDNLLCYFSKICLATLKLRLQKSHLWRTLQGNVTGFGSSFNDIFTFVDRNKVVSLVQYFEKKKQIPLSQCYGPVRKAYSLIWGKCICPTI